LLLTEPLTQGKHKEKHKKKKDKHHKKGKKDRKDKKEKDKKADGKRDRTEVTDADMEEYRRTRMAFSDPMKEFMQ
jgi:hypothetical protein